MERHFVINIWCLSFEITFPYYITYFFSISISGAICFYLLDLIIRLLKVLVNSGDILNLDMSRQCYIRKKIVLCFTKPSYGISIYISQFKYSILTLFNPLYCYTLIIFGNCGIVHLWYSISRKTVSSTIQTDLSVIRWNFSGKLSYMYCL